MFEKVRDMISEKLNVDADDIEMDTSFVDDLEADSISLFELIMLIEEEYDIEIDDETIEGISTVGDIVNFLEEIQG